MKTQITIASIILLSVCSYSQTTTKIIPKSESGQATIQDDNGKLSDTLATWEKFDKLKSNEKLYLNLWKFELIESGQAIIQHENGKFSDTMTTREGFNKLKSNEKLYLSPGRVELFEPLEINNINNIQIIGNETSLVAKIDMPVVILSKTHNVYLNDLLIVHEIGAWCAQSCISFSYASEIHIEKCTFDGSGYFGLGLSNVQRATIENNKFFNCEYGLAAWGCENLIVKNNSFSNNRGKDIMDNDSSQFTNDFKSENTFE